ncbi:4235_t:CDS:1, partial [Cetraspora pellucida]
PELEDRLPRHTSVWGQKVLIEWKSAPKVCFYCDQTGHIKRDCPQFKEVLKVKRSYENHRVVKQNKGDTDSDNLTFSENNPYINVEERSKGDKVVREEDTNDKENDTMSVSGDENLESMIENERTAMGNNNVMQNAEKVADNKEDKETSLTTVMDNGEPQTSDDGFTTVTYKKHKPKVRDDSHKPYIKKRRGAESSVNRTGSNKKQ